MSGHLGMRSRYQNIPSAFTETNEDKVSDLVSTFCVSSTYGTQEIHVRCRSEGTHSVSRKVSLICIYDQDKTVQAVSWPEGQNG